MCSQGGISLDEVDLKWHACAGRGLGLGWWLARRADGEQRWVDVVVVECSGGDGCRWGEGE